MTIGTKDITAWVTVVVAIVGSFVAAAVWAADEHETIRSWVIDQDIAKQTELKSDTSEKYIKQTEYKEDITQLDERQKFIKEDLSEVKELVKDIHRALLQNKKSTNDCN
jgi:hypothetical protein